METWKDIKGFEGLYQISDYGRVKSLSRKCGRVIRKEKLLTIHMTKDGYPKVRLQHGEEDKTARVHRLVAETFIPNPNGYETVNHIDGNKLNCHVSNLEWCNRSEQMYHAYKLGLKPSMMGTDNAQAKLTEEQVREIKRLYKPYDRNFSTVKLGEMFGVSNRVIGLIVRGLSYKNVN